MSCLKYVLLETVFFWGNTSDKNRHNERLNDIKMVNIISHCRLLFVSFCLHLAPVGHVD